MRQLDGVEIDRVFEDKAARKDQNRPELQELIKFVRGGDMVLVHSMDRLARNLDDLRSIRALADGQQGAGRVRKESNSLSLVT